MKKTAVEWLIEQWPVLESQIPETILNQAKEMEKQQIIDDYYEGKQYGFFTEEQYYKETFKKQ
jgi:hypothetical protein